ncbi:MAG: hypothetical protein EBX92_08425 [Actinobacteria bacterium]|nr:hypothetical protein [Actinomycetota bacterium]
MQQVLVNSLMTTEADFECLRFDLDLFKKVADHLATNEKDFTKGKRKIFLDWLTGTKDRDLLTIEEAWRGLDVVDRLAVIANVPDALLQDFLYTNLISPQLKSPTASTLLRIAVSEPKLIARVIIESIDMEAMKRLVDWGSDPKKKIPDPAELLLNRASKVSFSVAEDALKTAADAEEQLRKTISQLGKEELAHRATAEALDAAERKVADLERLVKYEADSRREALQSEIEVAQFATLKELCLVHRGLLLATKLVGETPKEFREVTKWTQRGLEGLGVEVFGLPGEIVPCDLVLHEARAPKGADVEILQVGYIMRVSRVVVLPALAQLVAKG